MSTSKSWIIRYIQRRWRLTLFILGLMSIMVITFLLYGLNVNPLGYMLIMWGTLVCFAAILDFRRFYAHGRHLERNAAGMIPDLSKLPDPHLLEEIYYRDMLEQMASRAGEAETELHKAAQRTSAYYTLWTHQIKTPIAGMRLLLDETPVDGIALEEKLLTIEHYVEMVLHYQRLNQDSADLVIKWYDLGGIVRGSLRKLSPFFIKNGLTVEVEVAPLKVLTDERWLGFVVEQVLLNAVKYTVKGGVTIRACEGQTGVVLMISDTGIGIRGADLPRIFDWGYTGENGRLEQRATGIGLSLSRSILSHLGHRISVESELGRGTVVSIHLGRDALEVE